MGLLKSSRAYLSGAMDYAPDHGIGWRRKFIELTKHLEIGIIDPTNKPIPCTSELGPERQTMEILRSQGRWDELRSFVKRFRREDLRFCDIADFLVVGIDPTIHTVGTYDEVFTAERQKKPLLCIIEGGKKRLPYWDFAVFRTNEIFESVEECVGYLDGIDNGTIPLDDRWVLIGQYLQGSKNALQGSN
jgi:hypothetical protein